MAISSGPSSMLEHAVGGGTVIPPIDFTQGSRRVSLTRDIMPSVPIPHAL
jgi:hypothetical protein